LRKNVIAIHSIWQAADFIACKPAYLLRNAKPESNFVARGPLAVALNVGLTQHRPEKLTFSSGRFDIKLSLLHKSVTAGTELGNL
jgi:hypothetical protein